MPKVSIIIPSYNGGAYIIEALESALSQTYQDFEVIIIDDGSTDNTREVIEQYRKRDPEKVRYLYQDNQGLACARNTGLRQARGNLIALLDADDQWLPERLEETVRAIESDEAVGLVHANIKRIAVDGTMIDVPQRDQRFLSGDIFNHIFLRKAHISCPTVLFRKACCDRVGFFDEKLARLGCEDRELWLRISQHYNIRYINKVLALYRMSKVSMSQDREKMLEARLYVINKFCPSGKGQYLKRRALAKIYRDIGDEFLQNRDFRGSKVNYLRSLWFWPFSVWAVINLLKAVLKAGGEPSR